MIESKRVPGVRQTAFMLVAVPSSIVHAKSTSQSPMSSRVASILDTFSSN